MISDNVQRLRLLDLLNSGNYSDFTLRCGSDIYHLHRNIVCPQSKYFEAALNADFKEGQSGEIDLREDDPQSILRMICYLYTLDYVDYEPESSDLDDHLALLRSHIQEPNSVQLFDTWLLGSIPGSEKYRLHGTLIAHARVYALGEKYDINGLKVLAATKFETTINKANEDMIECHDILAVLGEVYESTPASDLPLRSSMIRYCVDWSCILLEDNAFVESMENYVGLGAGFARGLSSQKCVNTGLEEWEENTKRLVRSAIFTLDRLIKSCDPLWASSNSDQLTQITGACVLLHAIEGIKEEPSPPW